jgi:hypothetical protein
MLAAAILSVGVCTSVAHALPQPQPQALTPTTPSSTSPNANTFGIYIKTSSPATFQFIADRAKAATWLGVTASIRDLSELGDYENENQIVIGDPAVSTEIAELATLHGISTLDLGTEGYELDSRMDPAEGHIWRVLIVTTTVAGARNALATLDHDQVGGGGFKQMRIRDYPDRPLRGFTYSCGTVGVLGGNQANNVDQWVEDREDDIDVMARRGINTIFFQTDDWFDLDATVHNLSTAKGTGLRALFDYCRNLAIEPAVSIILEEAAPPFSNAEHAVFREGKLIEGAVFNAQHNSYLENTAGNFDYRGQNLDWLDGNGTLPDQWSNYGSGGWSVITSGGSKKLVVSNAGANVGTKTTIPVVPGSFYVLKVVFSNIAFAPGGWSDPPVVFLGDARPNETRSKWFRTFYLAPFSSTNNSTITYECTFSAPPESLSLTDPTVNLGITTSYSTGVSIVVESMQLDRRNVGFKNLMLDPSVPYAGTTFPGLSLSITDMDGNTLGASNYDLTVPSGLDWKMGSDGPVSTIYWKGDTPPGGKVKVTYTLGVPSQPPGGRGSATTWCLSNGGLYAEYERMFRDMFTEGYGLNPKLIFTDIEEERGHNRCGRCIARGLSNRDYFREAFNTLQGMFDVITGADQTRLIVPSDMISPYHNGKDDDYQYSSWMGQPGASGLANNQGGIGTLDSRIIVDMWGREYAEDAVNAGWPANHSYFAGTLIGGDVEDWAKTAGWYGTNALGFTILKWQSYALPTSDEDRMLDYAWKRYKHPDASLHAFIGTDFITDEVGNHDVVLEKPSALKVRPYGRKVRYPNCTSTLSGSINWGAGANTSISESQLNSETFTKTYTTLGEKTVTLTVNATGCTTQGCSCGGVAGASTATIHVVVVPKGDGGCYPNCPEPEGLTTTIPEPQDQDLTAAIRAIRPNPFGSAVAIHFTVPISTRPDMEVFDVNGRSVKHAVLGEHAPGAWQWTWDGTNENGNAVGAGVYFVRARLGSTVQTRRLVKLDQ